MFCAFLVISIDTLRFACTVHGHCTCRKSHDDNERCLVEFHVVVFNKIASEEGRSKIIENSSGPNELLGIPFGEQSIGIQNRRTVTHTMYH